MWVNCTPLWTKLALCRWWRHKNDLFREPSCLWKEHFFDWFWGNRFLFLLIMKNMSWKLKMRLNDFLKLFQLSLSQDVTTVSSLKKKKKSSSRFVLTRGILCAVTDEACISKSWSCWATKKTTVCYKDWLPLKCSRVWHKWWVVEWTVLCLPLCPLLF